MNQNSPCEACGDASVIAIQESLLCGRCLWAVSLLLRNRMAPAPPAGAVRAEIVGEPGDDPVRQAIEDVQHLRQRLVELGGESTLEVRSA